MLYRLTQGQKNLVDTALYILGGAFGTGGAGLIYVLAHGPMWLIPLGGIIGAGVGYFVSDAISYVNTGTLPQPIAATLIALWQSQGLVAAQTYIAKLPADQQALANTIIAELQSSIAIAAKPA